MKDKPDNYLKLGILLALIIISGALVPAQINPVDLNHKKEQINKSIEYTNFLLNQTKKEKNATLLDLELLQSIIESRKALINQHRISQSMLIDTIAQIFLNLDTLQNDLENLKKNYRNLLKSAYLTSNAYQKALFIFASDDINQAWRRLKYYNHLSKAVGQKLEQIRQKESAYYEQIAKLEGKAERNQVLINEIFDEYTRLEDDLALKDRIIAELNERIGQLAAELKQNQKASRELEKKISAVVDHEIEKNKPTGLNLIGMSIPETDANYLLSTEFEENKGKLPWPVEKGVISEIFGEHNHPKFENLKIKNNGINILSHPNAKALSVFSGVVTRIMVVPNFNNVVIVRHGDYLSVYSNLSNVEVETGETVAVRQNIGTIVTDETNGKTELHFEIWIGKNQLDPASWLLDATQIILTGTVGN